MKPYAPLPRFPVTTVGSWPRPAWLLRAMKGRGRELPALQDRACLEALRAQEAAGVDIVTDGEQRRDDFHSFLCERVAGLSLLTMADLLEHVEDRGACEALLQTLDVPADAIRNGVVTGRLRARAPLVQEDFEFLGRCTERPIKVTLPGPYLLCRSGWVEKLSGHAYESRDELAQDVVALLHAELLALEKAGAAVVQFDEPVLSELVFGGKSAPRTFLCATLEASASPEQELELAVELLNGVVEGVRRTLTAVHVCRGNWSRDEQVLLSGSYEALLPAFARMKVGQFVLEYATERAGDARLLSGLPRGSWIGFGVVNPRTAEVEDPEHIARRVRDLVQAVGHERIHLTPDCGFGTFAERPVNTPEVARAKLDALVAAARRLREE